MSVDLIQEWKDKTLGNRPTYNNLRAIADFYGTGYPYSPDDSTNLLAYIALSLGYNYDNPRLFAMPYIQFIKIRIAGEGRLEGGSYLQTIVNHI
jgi:hypothetical protein